MWLSWRRFALFVILGFLICFQTPTVRAGLRRTGHGYPWRCLAPVLESGTKSGVTISQVVDLGSDQMLFRLQSNGAERHDMADGQFGLFHEDAVHYQL